MVKFHSGLVEELVEFAAAHFELNAPQGDGEPLRNHLEVYARDGDPESIAELAAAADPPQPTEYLWGYFLDLHSTRTGNGFGPCRLSRLEIRLWEEDEGVALAHWERRAIMALDACWLTATAEQQAAADKRKPKA